MEHSPIRGLSPALTICNFWSKSAYMQFFVKSGELYADLGQN